MIRFLQQENNRLVKALFVVIIAAASISMVVYLIPGLMGLGAAGSDTYAVVYPHWYSRFLSSGDEISLQKVQQATTLRIQQQYPQYAGNPMIEQIIEPQVGQQMVQQKILLIEAQKLGIEVTDEDVRRLLHTGGYAEVLYPNGKFIGDDAYRNLIAQRMQMTVADFESQLKDQIAVDRLRDLVSAGTSVSEKEVSDAYIKSNTKIKFDYAVISSDDVRKSINPTDAELQDFFKKNAARYATAVPEQRSITYFAFTADQVPGGAPQVSQQEIEAYYNAHKSEYQVPEQARSRHILISVKDGADAKTDAAAKAKAEEVLKQLEAGGSWKDLAKKYSDDPGSKDTGGELGFAQRGRMVPAFDAAIFSQKIGDIKIVKSQFGYHVVQVEERQAAHTQPLNEVLPTIQATLIRDKSAEAQKNYAQTLTSEANKNGMQKTAEAHHLQLVTTPPVGQQGVISALPDSTGVLSKAFAAKVGGPAESAQTGEGYAIFEVASIEKAHAPTFAEWKSHILEDYRNEKLPALLAQKTAAMANEAKNLNDLAKAAKDAGATVKTSDLVSPTGQVPDFGAVGQVAPEIFQMSPGNISGPINAGRTGVVVKLLDKQQPTAEEVKQNLDQTRDQLLNQRRGEAFSIFADKVIHEYQSKGLVRVNPKAAKSPLGGQ
ncbi:MAG: peptidyl-prolyl cis-trans isomerase [Acidobacteriota bacterium]|nr:peptidyl-prolyl cis-trans isomerase [Acidobacteriota bacterium]